MNGPADRPRVVLDCNVILQAIANESGPSGRIVALAETSAHELFLSGAIISELNRVLGYDEVRALSPNITPERINELLETLMYRATYRRHVRHAMDFPRDPKDEPYIDLVVASKAKRKVN